MQDELPDRIEKLPPEWREHVQAMVRLVRQHGGVVPQDVLDLMREVLLAVAEPLPCSVRVEPATVLAAGVDAAALLLVLGRRRTQRAEPPSITLHAKALRRMVDQLQQSDAGGVSLDAVGAPGCKATVEVRNP